MGNLGSRVLHRKQLCIRKCSVNVLSVHNNNNSGGDDDDDNALRNITEYNVCCKFDSIIVASCTFSFLLVFLYTFPF